MLRSAHTPGRRACDGWAFLLGLAGLAVAGLSAGCTSQSPQARERPPVVITVRNNSGIDLRTVSLCGPARADGQADSLGTISPVPRGTSQVLGRWSAAFPWPRVVEIAWTDDHDQNYTRKIALGRLLQQVSDAGRKALVLEIRPAGELVAY